MNAKIGACLIASMDRFSRPVRNGEDGMISTPFDKVVPLGGSVATEEMHRVECSVSFKLHSDWHHCRIELKLMQSSHNNQQVQYCVRLATRNLDHR